MLNKRLINTGGGGNQPEGTGIMLMQLNGTMNISIDDGVTWTQNAVGLPSSYSGGLIAWNGTNFAFFQQGVSGSKLGYVWVSPDGYNWTQTATLPYEDGGSMSVDKGNYNFVLGVNNYNAGGPAVYESADNGYTWTKIGSSGIGPDTAGFAAQYNGYGAIGGRTENWLRTSSAGNYIYSGGSQSSGAPTLWQNGRWFSAWVKQYPPQGAQVSTSSTPGRHTTWPFVTISGQPSTYRGYMNSHTLFQGDGVSKVIGNWKGFSASDPSYIYYTDNNGDSFQVWKSSGGDVMYPRGYHNGYFYYSQGTNLYKFNDFSSTSATLVNTGFYGHFCSKSTIGY
jgi:hypothetical protein